VKISRKMTAYRIPVFLIGCAALLGALHAATSKPKPLKPTELLVRQYDKLVAQGALLTREGWTKSSGLWSSSDPYPQSGEIAVEDLGGLTAEDWVKDNRAQVETKWETYYGKIDSSLRYKPDSPVSGGILMGRMIALVCVDSGRSSPPNARIADTRCAGEWKLEGPQRFRVASLAAALKYVTEMRDKATDPAIRKNANRTIESLKHMGRGCGTASAC
jgi:hypothetical protein